MKAAFAPRTALLASPGEFPANPTKSAVGDVGADDVAEPTTDWGTTKGCDAARGGIGVASLGANCSINRRAGFGEGSLGVRVGVRSADLGSGKPSGGVSGRGDCCRGSGNSENSMELRGDCLGSGNASEMEFRGDFRKISSGISAELVGEIPAGAVIGLGDWGVIGREFCCLGSGKMSGISIESSTGALGSGKSSELDGRSIS